MSYLLRGSAVLTCVLALCACDGKEDASPKATSSADAKPSATGSTKPAVAEGKCGSIGCPGDGSFSSMCKCKDRPAKVPFEVKYTGKYSDFFKQPE